MLFSVTKTIDQENCYFLSGEFLNPLLNDRILDWSKLKAFANVKINMTENSKFILIIFDNIVGTRENDGYHHFLLSTQCCQKASYKGLLKVVIVQLRFK